MSKNHKGKLSYSLISQNEILKGEKLNPPNTFSNRFNEKNYKSLKNKKYGSLSTGNKTTKLKRQLNSKSSQNYRGIDLKKVFRTSISPRYLNISNENNHIQNEEKNCYSFKEKKYENNKNYSNENIIDNFEKNDNINENKYIEDNYMKEKNNYLKNFEMNEKENINLNEYNYINKPYINNLNFKYNSKLNYNDIDNNKNNEYFNKYNNFKNNFIFNNKKDNNNNNKDKKKTELKNLLKKEYLYGTDKNAKIELKDNNNNETQFQNSIPSKILENEILNCPGESMSFTTTDNLINKNNFESEPKNKLFEIKENIGFDDIFYKINEYKSKFNNNINKNKIDYNYFLGNNTDIFNINSNKYQINKKINYYNERKNNNYKKNIFHRNKKEFLPYKINKENYTINHFYKTNNNYNKNINKESFYLYTLNNKINNNFELRTNKTINSLSNASFKKNIYLSENADRKNYNVPSKFLLKSIFDYNSTKNFLTTFSSKQNNLNYTNFGYKKNNNSKQNLEIQNYFGINKDGNRLDQLLKSIPRHNKENKFQNYKRKSSLLKVYIDKIIQKTDINKKCNNKFALCKSKSYNGIIESVMPANNLILK